MTSIDDGADARTPDASLSGQYAIGGDIIVNRLGFGAMRITGKGVWGEPENRDEALRVLRRLPELKVDFIDTADSYGPEVSENLIRETLHPYDGMLIATKGGLTRPRAAKWESRGDPAYLRACVEGSLKRLGVERIDLWQLHRIDSKVPREDQFGVVKEMQQEGLIRYVGLSEVSVEEIDAARASFTVVTVQNHYNLANRQAEAVLDYCERHRIGFIPWYPLANGDLAKPGSALSVIAERLGATPGQVALAWLLRRSSVMLPIPGTGKVAHLDENVAAAGLKLSDADFAALSEAAKR
jgi:pyridoxine 4-dehydrogenase